MTDGVLRSPEAVSQNANAVGPEVLKEERGLTGGLICLGGRTRAPAQYGNLARRRSWEGGRLRGATSPASPDSIGDRPYAMG